MVRGEMSVYTCGWVCLCVEGGGGERGVEVRHRYTLYDDH